MQDMQEVLTIKKRRRVLLASLPQSSIGQERIAGLLYITRMREFVVEWSGASFQRSSLPFVFKIPIVALNMTMTSRIIIGYFTIILSERLQDVLIQDIAGMRRTRDQLLMLNFS